MLNSFSKLNVHFPDGFIYSVDCGDTRAMLIDRSQFDRLMAEKAMDAGAEFLYLERCMTCERTDDSVVVGTASGSRLESKIVVGADGHSSSIRNMVCNDPPRMSVRGIQVDVKHACDNQDTIDIWIGSDVAPGFFAWSIPFEDMTRIGLCSEWSYGAPSEYLPALLRKAGMTGAEVVLKASGKIPLGVQRRTYGDRILLIGDSASQVKPISGGGLYPLLTSAECLAQTVRTAFDKDDFSSSVLSGYQRAWRKEIGFELKVGYRLRTMYNNLTDDELNSIRRIIDNPSIRDLAMKATIDHPSVMVLKALRNLPMTMRLFPYLMKGLLR